MTIQLTQDQKDFQEAIRAFVDKEIIPVARNMEHSGEYPTAIVEHMKEMGLFGMTIPEEFGGQETNTSATATNTPKSTYALCKNFGPRAHQTSRVSSSRWMTA